MVHPGKASYKYPELLLCLLDSDSEVQYAKRKCDYLEGVNLLSKLQGSSFS